MDVGLVPNHVNLVCIVYAFYVLVSKIPHYIYLASLALVFVVAKFHHLCIGNNMLYWLRLWSHQEVGSFPKQPYGISLFVNTQLSKTYLNIHYLVGSCSFRHYISQFCCIFPENLTAKVPQHLCGELMA